MSADDEPDLGIFSLTNRDCRDYSDALADVLCWFRGFAAAKPEAELPPSIDTLRRLNIMLKRHF